MAAAAAATGGGGGAPSARIEPCTVHITLPGDPLSHASGVYKAGAERALVLLWQVHRELSARTPPVPLYVRIVVVGRGAVHFAYKLPGGVSKTGLPLYPAPLPRNERMRLLLDAVQWAGVVARDLEVAAERAQVGSFDIPSYLPTAVTVSQPQLCTQARAVARGVLAMQERLLDVARVLQEPEQAASQTRASQEWKLACTPQLGEVVPRGALWADAAERGLQTWWRHVHDPAAFQGTSVRPEQAWVVACPHAATAMVNVSQQNLKQPFPLPAEKPPAEEVTPEQAAQHAVEWRALDMSLRSFAAPWEVYELPIFSERDVAGLMNFLAPPTQSKNPGMCAEDGEPSRGYLEAVRAWARRDAEVHARAAALSSGRRRRVYWHVLPAECAAEEAGDTDAAAPAPATAGISWGEADAAALDADPAVDAARTYAVALVPTPQDKCGAATRAVARALVMHPDAIVWAPDGATAADDAAMAAVEESTVRVALSTVAAMPGYDAM